MSKEILINGYPVTQQMLYLIEDLGWEYDRMSSSGKEAYDKLTKLLEVTDE